MGKFILAAFLAFMTLFFFATPFVFFLDPITVGILVVIGAFIIIAKGVLDPDVKKTETSKKSVELKNGSIKTKDSKFHEENEEIKVSNSKLIENKLSKRQMDVDSNACFNYGKLTDIDGNVYNTIQIGNQVWMAENLRVSRYRNGDLIPNVTHDIEWRDSQIGAWCNYDNNPVYDTEYGKLYNWYAVDDQRGLAPVGWHVPNDKEWQELIDYLGGKPFVFNKLIEAGKEYWIYNKGATNETLFSALPNGGRGNDSSFYRLGDLCDWWTSSEDKTNTLCAKNIYSHFFDRIDDIEIKTLGSYDVFKFNGNAVRCLRNIGIKSKITNDLNENEFIDESGVKYNATKTKLVKAPKDLKEYIILPTTQEICNKAFCNCNNLVSVDIPQSVTKISYKAFFQCENIKFIEIPESIVTIEDGAFSGCIKLNSLTVSKNNKNFAIIQKSLIDLEQKKLLYFPIQSTIKKYKVPDGVISISNNAFFFNCLVEEIMFPDSLKIIEKNSFSVCRNLKHVYLPYSLQSIGQEAFYTCQNLKSVNIHNSRTIIGTDVFKFCDKMELICIDYTGNTTDFKLYDELIDMFKNKSSMTILKTPIWTERIFQTIDTIVQKIAREVIAINDLTKSDVDSIIDGYYDAFVDYYDQYKANENEKAMVHLASYLDDNNWENLRRMIYIALQNKAGIVFSDIIFPIRYDNSHGLSSKLFLFLSTIENGETHYLTGERFFDPFINVCDSLKFILSDCNNSLLLIIQTLKVYNKGKDLFWINDIIGKLNSEDLEEEIKTEFLEMMNKK